MFPIRLLCDDQNWQGYRFVSKIQAPLIGETVHRSLAITYTYQKFAIRPIRSIIRGDASLLYQSFIVRMPSVEGPIHVHRQHLIWAWEYLRQIYSRRSQLSLYLRIKADQARFQPIQADKRKIDEWMHEARYRFYTFGIYLDRLSDFEDRGCIPMSFGQGRMRAAPPTGHWYDLEPSDDPALFPAAVFIYALQVLRNRTGLADIGDPDVQARLQDLVSEYDDLDYDVDKEGGFAMGIKLDEAVLDAVNDPEVETLVRAGAMSDDIYRIEPLASDLLSKLAATESLRLTRQVERLPLEPSEDRYRLPEPEELLEPTFPYKTSADVYKEMLKKARSSA